MSCVRKITRCLGIDNSKVSICNYVLAFNRIQLLNGRLFRSLKSLEDVGLLSNNCINRLFSGPSEIAGIEEVATSMCGFPEETEVHSSSRVSTTSSKYRTDVPTDGERSISQIFITQRQQSEALEVLVNQTLDQKKVCLLEVRKLQDELLKCSGLNIQYQKDLSIKDAEYLKMLEAKGKEIAALQYQLQTKTAELRMAEEYIKRQNTKFDSENV